jgi:nicotinamidase-related amidase
MKPVLIVIDVQKGFDDASWGKRNNLDAEEKMLQIISTWRKHEFPIIHVQHVSQDKHSTLHPSNQGFSFKKGFEPQEDEYLIRKKVNSAFIGTELESYLKNNGFQTIVIIGLTTNHCVSTTARMAGNLRYQTFVCHDATACFNAISYDGVLYGAEEVHRLALTSLHKEFGEVVSVEEVIERLVPSKHEYS